MYPELLTDRQRETLVHDFKEHQAKMARREKRNRWAKNYGLAILTGVLLGEVMWLADWTGLIKF